MSYGLISLLALTLLHYAVCIDVGRVCKPKIASGKANFVNVHLYELYEHGNIIHYLCPKTLGFTIQQKLTERIVSVTVCKLLLSAPDR